MWYKQVETYKELTEVDIEKDGGENRNPYVPTKNAKIKNNLVNLLRNTWVFSYRLEKKIIDLHTRSFKFEPS